VKLTIELNDDEDLRAILALTRRFGLLSANDAGQVIIDVRGSNDSAMIEAAVNRAMSKAFPAVVTATRNCARRMPRR